MVNQMGSQDLHPGEIDFHLACNVNTEICCRTQVAVPRPATQIKDSRGPATIELDIYSG